MAYEINLEGPRYRAKESCPALNMEKALRLAAEAVAAARERGLEITFVSASLLPQEDE